MDFDKQLLFFFSALGAFNGLLMSLYFLFFTKNKHRSNYFLGALLLVVSIRIAKSIFLFFNPNLSEVFIHVGLSACFLIGPFLYLYTAAINNDNNRQIKFWYLHVIPVLFLIFVMGYLYPYRAYNHLWRLYFVKGIYFYWFIYIVLSGIKIRKSFRKLFIKTEKLDELEIWALNIVMGISFIWVAYNTTAYTSYIAGALSFSFVFYLLILFWILKRGSQLPLFEKQLKYEHKKIESDQANSQIRQLKKIMVEDRLFVNPNLKISDVAEKLGITSHFLSQIINEHVGINFATFINGYRVDAAEEMLKKEHHLTVEGIGLDCGFKSNSSFYAAFKKLKGVTPAKFRKEIA